MHVIHDIETKQPPVKTPHGIRDIVSVLVRAPVALLKRCLGKQDVQKQPPIVSGIEEQLQDILPTPEQNRRWLELYTQANVEVPQMHPYIVNALLMGLLREQPPPWREFWAWNPSADDVRSLQKRAVHMHRIFASKVDAPKQRHSLGNLLPSDDAIREITQLAKHLVISLAHSMASVYDRKDVLYSESIPGEFLRQHRENYVIPTSERNAVEDNIPDKDEARRGSERAWNLHLFFGKHEHDHRRAIEEIRGLVEFLYDFFQSSAIKQAAHVYKLKLASTYAEGKRTGDVVAEFLSDLKARALAAYDRQQDQFSPSGVDRKKLIERMFALYS